jgi:hypothetical protein
MRANCRGLEAELIDQPLGRATVLSLVSLPLSRSKSGLTACYAAPILNEAVMRVPALAILTIGTVLTAAPARAQTYDPDYPVCMQVYDIDGGYIACRYTSLAQCAQSASGLAAQCIANPYFAGACVPAGSHYRRHSRVY